MRLKYKLMLIIMGITLVSIIAAAFWGYSYSKQQAASGIDDFMTAKVDGIASEMDNWVARRANTIETLGNVLEETGSTARIIREHLQAYKNDPSISDIYIGFEDGRFISGLGWTPPQGYDPRKRPWYIQAKQADKLNISQPYLDMTTGQYAISVGIPLKDKNGHLIGILAEDLLLTTIMKTVQDIDLQGLGYGMLIDSQGNALAHPDPELLDTNMEENLETREITGKMLAGPSGRFDYRYRGQEKSMVYKRLSRTGWTIGLSVERDKVYEPLKKLGMQYIVIAIVMSLLAMGFSIMAAQELTKRLVELRQKALQLAKGDLNAKSNIRGNDEISDLSKTFNYMTDQLSATVCQLKGSEEKYRNLIESSADYIYSIDLDGRFTAANKSFCSALKQDENSLIGKRIEELPIYRRKHELWSTLHQRAIDERRVLTEQLENMDLDGTSKHFDLVLSPIYQDETETEIVGIIGTMRDITETKRYEMNIYRLAYYDALTGLPNRTLAIDNLRKLVRQSDEQKTKFALFLLDLDDFKKINDTLGHAIGDWLLVQIAESLKTGMTDTNLLSRIGGDEFLVVINGVEDEKEIIAMANQIMDVFNSVWKINDIELYIKASMGVAIYPDDTENINELLKKAETAMYNAKRARRSEVCFYNTAMEDRLKRKMEIENGLRHALEKDAFFLHFQPIITLEGQVLRGFEALIRWVNTDGQTVSPAQFIPVAEETGLINSIGEWVLRTACQKNRNWQQEYGIKTVISVNISPVQLKQRGFAELVARVLDETEMDPACLELEITEGIVIESLDETVQLLEQLKTLGIKISMDDFGTGYSSLSYLKHLPIDTLKIDRSFVDDIGRDDAGRVIAGPMISLMRDMGLETIAEGVEDEKQYEYLKSFACEHIQGYYLYKPMHENDLRQLLEKYKGNRLA